MLIASQRHPPVGRRYQLAFFCLLAFSSSVFAQSSSTQEFQQTYPVSPTGEVRVRTKLGNIRVTGWDRPEVKVDAVKRANSREQLSSAEVVVQKYDKGLCIGTKYAAAHHLKDWFGFNSNYCRDPQNMEVDPETTAAIDYTVSVPRTAALVLLTDTGDVEIEGTTEYVFIDIQKGHLTARDVSGDCKLYGSYSGVNVTLTTLPRDTHIQVGVGPLNVYLSAAVSARVRAHAGRGVDNDFGWSNRTHDDLEGTVGGGKTLLDLINSGGRVEIHRLQLPSAADKKTRPPTNQSKVP